MNKINIKLIKILICAIFIIPIILIVFGIIAILLGGIKPGSYIGDDGVLYETPTEYEINYLQNCKRDSNYRYYNCSSVFPFKNKSSNLETN